jgi:alpha-beta hydrolase superfamily lysophospholipase
MPSNAPHGNKLQSALSSLWFALKPKLTGVRHHPSGLPIDAWMPKGDLDRYVDETLERIAEARRRLDASVDAAEIAAAAPFRLPAQRGEGERRRAVLMVHGLSDTSFVTRDLAAFFSEQGFEVLSVLLPGHGTCPGDLLKVGWRDWLAALRAALDALSLDNDEIYLCGFSMGAALSIYEALLDERVCGLFLFAPALQLPRIAGLTHGVHGLTRWLPHLHWVDVQPDEDPYKYESMSTNAIVQTARLVERMQRLRRLRDLEVPLFVAASEDDLTVVGPAALEFFKAAKSDVKRMIYYTRGRPAVPEQVRIIHSRIPERHIVSAAHTALIVAPDNPHYGEAGAYAFCTHYYRTHFGDYLRCKSRKEDCLGEIGRQPDGGQILRRLTFNPWWDQMLEELKGFIERLPPPAPRRQGTGRAGAAQDG